MGYRVVEKFVDLRVNLGWTLSQLAMESGADTGTVSRAERGMKVSAPTAKAIADAFSRAYGREIKVTDIGGLNVRGLV